MGVTAVSDLILKLIEIAGHMIPFRVVWAWEVGLYFVAGKYRFQVRPGLKLVVPWLCDVRTVSTVPDVYTLSLQNVMLSDGSALTFSASVSVVVTDASAAYLKLGHYTETVQEIAASVIAEEMARLSWDQIMPEDRAEWAAVRDRIRIAVNNEIGQFGLNVVSLRLNNFFRGPTVRLLTDPAAIGSSIQRPAPV
jgi:regulator of protease activity HflC (stomatin/prohibitin superfamily)